MNRFQTVAVAIAVMVSWSAGLRTVGAGITWAPPQPVYNMLLTTYDVHTPRQQQDLIEIFSQMYGGTFAPLSRGFANDKLEIYSIGALEPLPHSTEPLSANTGRYVPKAGMPGIIGPLGRPVVHTDAPLMGDAAVDPAIHLLSSGPDVPYWMATSDDAGLHLIGRTPLGDNYAPRMGLYQIRARGSSVNVWPPFNVPVLGYVYFWELSGDRDHDERDFLDFVIGTDLSPDSTPAAVPLPPALLPALAVMGLIAIHRLRLLKPDRDTERPTIRSFATLSCRPESIPQCR